MRVLLLVATLLAVVPAASAPPPAASLARALDDYSAGRFAPARAGFRLLADQGSAIGETMLGVLYDRGQGGPADPATATAYWLRAANRSYAPAQLALAQALARGRGVPRDTDAAWLWASLAARSDSAAVAGPAQALADRLRRGQAPAVAQTLDRRLAGWRPWPAGGD